jgi:iron complex transport system permease protein
MSKIDGLPLKIDKQSKSGELVIRCPPLPFSFRWDRRVPVVLLVLAVITLVAIAIAIGYGEYAISPINVIKILLGISTGDRDAAFVVTTLRLPRTLVAFFVGASLGIAGTIVQGIARNPLAAPGIIGINGGASLAAVICLVWWPQAPVSALPIAAFLGGIAIAFLIYILAWRGGTSSARFILVGIGFSFIATAATDLTIVFGEIDNVSQALIWLAGSVYGRSWDQVWALLPWLVVCGAVGFAMARELNILALGEDVARGLGSPVEWRRGTLLFCGVALAAASVATAGSIQFVGLMAPHLSRKLVGSAHEGLMPTAAMVGGTIVVLADVTGRLLFSPIELPCGIVTAIIGAPYLLFLLLRKNF